MKITGSEVVVLDGESKCGKTTIMDAITRHSGALQGLGAHAASLLVEKHGVSREADSVRKLLEFGAMSRFDTVVQISAGNYYRAAAGYVIGLERLGKIKDSFTPRDAGVIKKMIASDEGRDMLQNDETIGTRVSRVAQYSGAQALCSTLFATSVQEAFLSGGDANLVLADARDPIGHLQRNDLLGTGSDQIHPLSIVPIYIDTPPEIAAERMKGDYDDNLRTVLARRHADRTRAELPFTPPNSDQVITDFGIYRAQFSDMDRTDVAKSYLFDNGSQSSLEYVEYMGELMAHVVSDAGLMRSYAQTVG